jgi:arylsulfatase A-like enzyme
MPGRVLEGFRELAAVGELRSDVLDLAFLAGRQDLQGAGWMPVEEDASGGLWNRQPSPFLVLPFFSSSAKSLRLRVRAREGAAPGLKLTLYLNDTFLDHVPLGPGEQAAVIPLPPAVQAAGDNRLAFVTGREGGDVERGERRKLFSLAGLEVRPEGSERATPPAAGPDGVWLPPRSALSVALRARTGTMLDVRGEAGAAAARLSVRFETPQGATQVADASVPPGRGLALRSVLDAPAGAFARLELANHGPGGLRLLDGGLDLPASPKPRPASGARLPGRPNVVVFLTDTLRADGMGAYGSNAPSSPRFDAFAREAVLFEDAWAQCSWTQPSVASLFTSLHVGSHGLGGPDHALVDGLDTLAESLKAAGYRTGAFVANHVVNARTGFTQGFDAWNPAGKSMGGAPASTLVEHALAWVAAGAGPFFLYVHTLEPHAPYDPKDADWRPLHPAPFRGVRDSRALLRRERLAPEELAFLRSRYLGEVRANDRGFGALLDGLRSRGLLDTSLVIFLADHGEEFQEHGGMEHAHTLYQEQLHIPMAVRLPGARGGGRRDTASVQHIDVFPTLATLVGARIPDVAEGRDLSARWLGGAAADDAPRESLAELRFPPVRKLALRLGNLKLVINDDPPSHWRAKAPLELYDLATDPGERRNLADEQPLAAAYLKRRARELRLRHEATRLRLQAGATIELTEEAREQLRALGYIR